MCALFNVPSFQQITYICRLGLPFPDDDFMPLRKISTSLVSNLIPLGNLIAMLFPDLNTLVKGIDVLGH
jgi:hypothetical protein